MSLNYQAIGRRIRNYRKLRNIPQNLFAEMVGKSPTYMSYLENGSKHPSLETLLEVANILGVTPDMLLSDNLMNNNAVLSMEVQQLLRDCSDTEKRILIQNARELKRILRENLGGGAE